MTKIMSLCALSLALCGGTALSQTDMASDYSDTQFKMTIKDSQRCFESNGMPDHLTACSSTNAPAAAHKSESPVTTAKAVTGGTGSVPAKVFDLSHWKLIKA